MFKLEPLTDVSWPVTIRKPLSGGKHESIKVEITYPLVESDEYDELMKLSVAEVVPRVVKGWRERDFGDADGTPLAFSAENLARLHGEVDPVHGLEGPEPLGEPLDGDDPIVRGSRLRRRRA